MVEQDAQFLVYVMVALLVVVMLSVSILFDRGSKDGE